MQAVHQDGVTCLQLVVAGARSAQQRERSGGGDGGRSSPTCPSYEDSGVSDDSGGVCLTLCTSSKDCSLKICSLKREVRGSSQVDTASCVRVCIYTAVLSNRVGVRLRVRVEGRAGARAWARVSR